MTTMNKQPNTEGVGTKATGFAHGKLGPFRCDHCAWFSPGGKNPEGKPIPIHCHHPDVAKDAEVKKDADGHSLVDGDDCCDRYRPKEKLFEKLGSDCPEGSCGR